MSKTVIPWQPYDGRDLVPEERQECVIIVAGFYGTAVYDWVDDSTDFHCGGYWGFVNDNYDDLAQDDISHFCPITEFNNPTSKD